VVRRREPITMVEMLDRFPAIEPYDADMLDVGDGCNPTIFNWSGAG
jgi:hypothetical protein